MPGLISSQRRSDEVGVRMTIELQIKMWEVLTAYREHLLDLGLEEFAEFDKSLAKTPGFEEYEDRMRMLWIDDLEELED